MKQFPDWRLSSGHAHPDANSFIIFARGEYLTGDTGYAGLPMTEHHNTLLVNGKGQAKEGAGHDVFAAVPYELLNGIRISEVKVEKDQVLARGDATAAYGPELGLKKFVREFVYAPAKGFTIRDAVETASDATFTVLLHSDGPIETYLGNRFFINAGNVKVLVDPKIEELQAPSPGPPALKQMLNTIEDNTVTAPGPPGAVDKGPRQIRGQKLLISNRVPASSARFTLRLSIKN